MLNIRSPLILAGPPAGLVIAAVIWFAFDGAVWVTGPLDRLEARADAARPHTRAPISPATNGIEAALASPLFALTAGQGAVADPVIRLDGVAMSPRGQSALISVDGTPAAWMGLGATHDGVTLMEVRPTKVVVDTPASFKEVPLWGASPGAPGSAAGDAVPSGFHLPPAPASAPTAPR